MVTVYSVHYNRPEWVLLQHSQLEKCCTDEYKHIVVNNGIDVATKSTISSMCKILNIQEIVFEQGNRQHYCSHDGIMAFDYIYRNHISKDIDSDIRVLMDSDVFPFRKFSFYNILKDNDIVGLEAVDAYFSAIYTMYSKAVDLVDFNINAGGDAGSGTGSLLLKYKNSAIPTTAPIRKLEGDYIFRNKENTIPYDSTWGFHFMSDCLIHYYRGTGWDNGGTEYYRAKFNFLIHFLNNVDLYSPILDENICYGMAFADQWLHPNNYRLYKIPGYELSNISN